jgi:hypothetical protein
MTLDISISQIYDEKQTTRGFWAPRYLGEKRCLGGIGVKYQNDTE